MPHQIHIPKIKPIIPYWKRDTKQIRIDHHLYKKIQQIANEDELTMSKLLDYLVKYSLKKLYKGR